MLNIATPTLSAHEWRGVRTTLSAVADFGCGRAHALPMHLRPVQDFLCETGRTRHISERHADILATQGFSRAQIEALALLGS